MSTLFGAGYVGLRSLVTGIPAAVLLRGPRALADAPVAPKGQYFILQTSGQGDPINANVPGTYTDTKITHSADPTMAPTSMMVGSTPTTAALPWSTLPSSVLARTTFWHIMTNTPVHPREPDVMSLLNTTQANEMLPSLLTKALAPTLGTNVAVDGTITNGTLQQQPITLGAINPSEGLRFGGQALPIIPPLALKATLANPNGTLAGITSLQKLRDDTLSQISDIYRRTATKAQKSYLDSVITSQTQIRSIDQNLLDALAGITDNSVASQITAAIVLIQMNVTPVVAIHIPFGGDNHSDVGLAGEAKQTVAGVASIASLMAQLATAKDVQGTSLVDQVSFLSLNVFGRTIGPVNTDGRQHNPNHQVSLAIGKPFRGGIIGGVAPVGTDYGALAIDSSSGAGQAGGDIPANETLASFGKTVLAAVGVDAATIDKTVTFGKVVKGALA
jgi:hypothetical protein